MIRKIIQICESAMEECSNISALCDDGTVWYLNDIRKGWRLYPEIPQDKPEYFEYLITNIDELYKKYGAEGLNDEEKEELKDLLEALKRYKTSREY
ncbi:DUF896 domain-containing protein [Glaesserella parasuis]|nr:DUF896 domain-containing protein [Glaesserella parasuis]MCT8686293.1 DUF896 domain-containing protein [Glaesserella parasuis]MCT8813564.1 DUF896 domain-containing protein [Glaesserella parasuis]MCT8845116.1 DUF896 domain-containing protein [Glaesserella parasuis]MDE3965302.1 DUF896 domain-containing protein [Glaesserella parasuis]